MDGIANVRQDPIDDVGWEAVDVTGEERRRSVRAAAEDRVREPRDVLHALPRSRPVVATVHVTGHCGSARRHEAMVCLVVHELERAPHAVAPERGRAGDSHNGSIRPGRADVSVRSQCRVGAACAAQVLVKLGRALVAHSCLG